MAERVRIREIDDDEGNRLLRTIRRSAGSVVTWRRAQMVLLSAQGMPVSKIAGRGGPGRQWAERGGKHKDPEREPRPRIRATYNRYGGVRHLFAAYDLAKDKLYGHIKPTKNHTKFLEFCRYLRGLYPARVRIAIVCDNFSRT
jgi:hypothetical protein